MVAGIFFIVWSLIMFFAGACYGLVKGIDAPEEKVAGIKQSIKRCKELTKELREIKEEQKMLKAKIKEQKKLLKQLKREG